MNSFSLLASGLKCDFCSTTPISRAYDAAPIQVQVRDSTVHFLDTKWAACAECAALIDAERWNDLTNRSIALWREELCQLGLPISASDLAEIHTFVDQLHHRFREARKDQ